MSSAPAASAVQPEALEVAAILRRDFSGRILLRDSPEFPHAARIWNSMVARTPGVILQCANVADIQRAVRACSGERATTAVKCGGHSLAGFSTCDGGVVIDLCGLRSANVDSADRTARVGGGCLLGNIDTATQRAGLVFPAGVVSHTGAAGLILGGGTGWLTRRFGLSCDNVLGFQIVMADGTLLNVNEREHPDLFWALRGGGGNFGVVTEFHLKLHPLSSVLISSAWFAEHEAAAVLRCWREFMPDAPDELKWNISLAIAPNSGDFPSAMRGRPALSQTVIWIGDHKTGQRYLAQTNRVGSPVASGVRELSYLELQTMADSEFPHGGRYYTKSGYFKQLDDRSIDVMLQALATIPAERSQIELAYLGGACGRVAADETAFGDRSAPFVLNSLGQWNDAEADKPNIEWVRQLFRDLRPQMTPGVYVNFMSGDEEDRVQEAYRARWDRLLRIKQTYDPQNFFCRNQNIVERSAQQAPQRA